MQCSDEKDLHMPLRNDCIRAIDVFLADGLGYGEKVNDINKTLAARTAGYGQIDQAKSPLLFAANILDLIPSPEVYALQSSGYLSRAIFKILVPIFMNRSKNNIDIDIRCRRCRNLIALKAKTTPVTIRCRRCQQEYVVEGVWTTQESAT